MESTELVRGTERVGTGAAGVRVGAPGGATGRRAACRCAEAIGPNRIEGME